MYAVFISGGQQHRVREGETIRLQKLNAPTGEQIDFTQVLMVSHEGALQVGAPYVAGSVVKAEVVSHGRGKKIHIVKFQRRKHSRKMQGHRQWYTDVAIKSIQV